MGLGRRPPAARRPLAGADGAPPRPRRQRRRRHDGRQLPPHLPRLPRPAPRRRGSTSPAATTRPPTPLAGWLAARPEVTAVLPIWNAAARFRDWPLELYGFRDHATYRDNWPLLAALPDAWDRVARGEAVLVSEQLARRFGLRPGDTARPPHPRRPLGDARRRDLRRLRQRRGPGHGRRSTPSPPAGPTSTAAAWRCAPTPTPCRASSPTSRAAFRDRAEAVDQRGLKAASPPRLREDLRRHRRPQRPDPRRRRHRAPHQPPHPRRRPPRPARPALGDRRHPPPPRPHRARQGRSASPPSPRSPPSPSASRSPGCSPRSSTSAPSAGACRSSSSPATGRRLFALALATAALAALWPALRLRRASPLDLLQRLQQ